MSAVLIAREISQIEAQQVPLHTFMKYQLDGLQQILTSKHQDPRLIRSIWVAEGRSSYIVVTEATENKVAGLYEISWESAQLVWGLRN